MHLSTPTAPGTEADTAAAHAFIAHWQAANASERSSAQTFVNDLCALLGVERPHPTPDESYKFERHITLHHGDGSTSSKFADCYKRGHFVLEAKKLRAASHTKSFDNGLLRARSQAETYARALPAQEGRPPFVLVVDVGTVIEVYAEFSRTGGTYTPFPDPRSHRLQLADLARPEVRHRLHRIWTDPDSLNPARISAQVTRKVAALLADLAKWLESGQPPSSKYKENTAQSLTHQAPTAPEIVANYLTRCLFCMFAEDVQLLPAGSFTALLQHHRHQPAALQKMLASLWADMDSGGFSPALAQEVLHFNGKLFKGASQDGYSLRLTPGQIDLLIEAARADWRAVEPAIFGTLLERALHPSERHALGAHYTPRAYVERLVLPAVIEPLRAQWANAQAAALVLAHEASALAEALPQVNANTKSGQDALRRHEKAVADLCSAAQGEVRHFLRRLAAVRVLDPACGSGNFLYVTLEHFKRLEGEVLNQLDALGEENTSFVDAQESVTLRQFIGIELNKRAAALAELVLWIGFLQWHIRTHGARGVAEPVVHNYGNIECRDAVLAWDAQEPAYDDAGQRLSRWDGRTYKTHPVTGEHVPDEAAQVPQWRYVGARPATWPQADFIVGNPPFIGKLRMREALGDGYVEALRSAWPEVPDSADFVMYWWHRAAAQVAAGHTQRMGLITTNSLTMIYNRRVVQATMDKSTHLLMAIPDHPWVDSANGAAVRIAMTVLAAGNGEGQVLTVTDEQTGDFGEVSVNLHEQRGLIHADLKIGANVTQAKPLQANSKLSSAGVIPHGVGMQLTTEEAAALEPDAPIKPYRNGKDLTNKSRDLLVIDCYGLNSEQVRNQYPKLYQWLLDRVKPERDVNKDKDLREKWWLHRRNNEDMRRALAGLPRYVATVMTAKHRVFQFLDGAILPDQKLVAIGLDDAFSLGILSSQLHIYWALALGGRLGVGNDPVYSKSTCFDTFPFPDEDTGLTPALRERIAQLAEQIDAHRKQVLAAGHQGLTLTGMYNVLEALRAGRALTAKEKALHTQGLVGVLRELHDELDVAVLTAYGLSASASASTDAILAHLVQLNTQRAQEEAQGHIRWLRPSFQNPQKSLSKQELVPLDTPAQEADSVHQKPLSKEKRIQPWPATLPEQVAAVAALLSASPSALTLADIEARFKGRGAWKKTLPTLLQTLAALGRAQSSEDAAHTLWRA